MASISEALQLAVQHHQAGNFQQAESLYRQILQAEPRNFDALHLLGVMALQLGRHDLAVDYIGEALRLRPEVAEAHNSLGAALIEQGRPAQAETHLRRALELKPQFVEALVNLGNACKDQGKLGEAVAYYGRTLAIRPGYAEALVNLGHALTELGRADEAVTHLLEAIRLNPNLPEAHNNLGNAFREQMKWPEALAGYHEAIRLRPSFADAHRNLGIVHLSQGNFAQGWPEYEWRWRCKDFSMPPLRQPIWDGAPLAGRSILLHAEQGLGDAIQFIRFAPLVKARGAGRIYLGCSPPLLRLLATAPGIDAVFPGDPLPPFDVHLPLLSLPSLLGIVNAESLAMSGPYLNVNDALVQTWRTRLGKLPGYRVGIVWRGRPEHRGDRWRSASLKQFAELAKVPGVSLVSLQKEPGREELANMPGVALDLGPELTDLTDTAAVLKNLDLLVSVDTSVAHLAGALGVPAWVALPFVPDWRWLQGREDCIWYPSLRLFRQSKRGDWDSVFARIKAEIGTRGAK